MTFWWCVYNDNSWLVAFTAPLDKWRCCMAEQIRVMTGKTKQSSGMGGNYLEKTEPCCCCELFILLQNVWQGNGRPRWVLEVEISQQTPRTQISHKTSKKTEYYPQRSLAGSGFLFQDVIYLQEGGMWFDLCNPCFSRGISSPLFDTFIFS